MVQDSSRPVGNTSSLSSGHLIEDVADDFLLHRVLSSVDAPIFVKDAEGRFLYVNRSFEIKTGLMGKAIRGKSAAEVLDPDEARAHCRNEQQLFETAQPHRYIAPLKNASTGQRMDAEFHLRPFVVDAGFQEGLVGVIFDVTSHRQILERIEDLNQQLWNSLLSTVEILGRAQEWNDSYTVGHQQRVAELAVLIGRELGLPSEDLEAIRLGALIHDVGKMRVDTHILNKTEKLAESEWLAVKEHVVHGVNLLDGIAMSPVVLEIVHNHHERLDGSGYPRALLAHEISINVRVVSVADVIEAMTQPRPYRESKGWDAALSEITVENPDKYDAEVVKAAIRVRDKGYPDWLIER